MSDSRVIVRLKIESETESCDDITAAIGLTPSKQWGKGESRPGTSIAEGRNIWIHERAYERAENLESHVSDFLKHLGEHQSKIASVAERNPGTLSVVVYTNSAPPLFFEQGVVSRISRLGLSLDIDLYI